MLKTAFRARQMAGVLVLFVFALSVGYQRFSPARFDEEKIEVWALEGQVQVTGYYHYVNSSFLPTSFSLSLPFPVDLEHPLPSTFFVSQVDHKGGQPEKEIVTHFYKGDVVFRVWLLPRQGKWIRVDYVQGTKVAGARYILLTTREWRRPLDRGEYTLHLGQGLELVSSNYPLTQASPVVENRYMFSAENFFPSHDWEIQWASQTSHEEKEHRQYETRNSATVFARDSVRLRDAGVRK